MVKVASAVALGALAPCVAALFIPDYITSKSAAAAGPETFSAFDTDEYRAPLHTSANAKTIADHYIVVFHPHVGHEDIADHHFSLQTLLTLPPIQASPFHDRQQLLGWHNPLSDLFGTVKHTFNITNKLKGYSGTFSSAMIDLLRMDPRVAYIEHDQEVHICERERNAPWGLARISHKDSLGFSTFNKYDYDARAGEGVTAYVVDTGVNIHHEEFEGRAVWGATIPVDDEDEDGNGHGTHVAGTIASKTYGVAKKAKIVAVKVLRSNGSGTMSDVLKGVEWAAEAAAEEEAAEKKKGKKSKYKGSTANMSLGGGSSKTLDLAVNAAVDAGLHFAVAAGNDNQDACNYSPAAAEKAVTVGATSLSDSRAYFSNHGKCVDIFAPGLNILSTWIGSEYATNTISGTSMASPHICGLLSYFLSLAPPADSDFSVPIITPAKLKKRMISIATPDMLDDIPAGTVNLVAWNGGLNKNGTSDFTFDDDAEPEHTGSWTEPLREELDRIEKEAVEWMDKAKEFLRKEVARVL